MNLEGLLYFTPVTFWAYTKRIIVGIILHGKV